MPPLFAVQTEGTDVTTIEGLSALTTALYDAIQQASPTTPTASCGFCTPGFVVLGHRVPRCVNPSPGDDEIRHALSGNLCRCTGYQGIVDAVQIAAETMSPQGA